MLNARHSALHESVAGYFGALPGWQFAPEVSFSIFGERGVVDILAYHAASGSLLVIELKTEIVDVNELVGTLDRKNRLGRTIAAERGWQARSVSRWVIVTRGRTNERRIQAHRSMLRAAYPSDGRAMRRWLADPVGTISALSMWTDVVSIYGRRTHGQRIRVRAGDRDHR